MGSSVILYNPTATAVTISINNGQTLLIEAATSSHRFMPTSPALDPELNPMPSPGNFGYGSNSLQVVARGETRGHQFTVNVSNQYPLDRDLQCYIYYHEDPTIGLWVLMRNGEVHDHGNFVS